MMKNPTTLPFGLRRKYLFLLLIILILLWWFWPSKQNSNNRFNFANLTTPVSAVEIKNGELNISLNALGTVTAAKTVTIRSRVDGTLLDLKFTDGQLVNKDDVLAVIDPEPFKIKLNQALGQQAQTSAKLILAKQDLKRYEKLYKQDSVAKQVLDDARAKYAELLGQAKIDAAAVADAKLQLDYSQIKAPIAGRLGISRVDVGNLIKASDTDGLVVLTQNNPIDVIFSIAQTNLPKLLAAYKATPDLTVEIYNQTSQKLLATGVLKAIDNQIDAATGTVQLKASFANSNDILFPNQFVQTKLILGKQSGLLVPLRSIMQRSSGQYVYQIKPDNTVSMVTVKTLVDDGENAIVLADLKPGSKIVLEGTDRLKEGSKVEIIEPNQNLEE